MFGKSLVRKEGKGNCHGSWINYKIVVLNISSVCDKYERTLLSQAQILLVASQMLTYNFDSLANLLSTQVGEMVIKKG